MECVSVFGHTPTLRHAARADPTLGRTARVTACSRRLRSATATATSTQAQSVIAAAILRQLHAVVTTGQAWDPQIATAGIKKTSVTLAA